MLATSVDQLGASRAAGTRKAAEALVPLLKPQARVVFLASQAGSSAYKGCSPAIQKRWAALDLTVGQADALCAEYVAAAKAGTHKLKSIACMCLSLLHSH